MKNRILEILHKHKLPMNEYFDNAVPSNEFEEVAEEIVKLFATPDVMKSVCPDCKGNGWTIPSDRVPYDCKKCNGTGQTVL